MTVLPENVERVAVSVADFPSLGDQLVLFPLFEGLRRRFPGCRILAASRNELIRLATEFGFADEALIYSKTDWALLRAVRRFRPQLSICLRRRSPRANLCFGRLSGARWTVGYRGGGNGLWHTHLATFHENIYRARRHLAPLETLGGSGDLRGTVRSLARTSNWKPRSRPYAVLSPCGAWDRKQWGAARYAEVASRLAELHPDLAWYAVLGPREMEQGCDDAFRKASVRIDVVANAPIDDLARSLAAGFELQHGAITDKTLPILQCLQKRAGIELSFRFYIDPGSANRHGAEVIIHHVTSGRSGHWNAQIEHFVPQCGGSDFICP